MARMGRFSAQDLKRFQKQLEGIRDADPEAFIESCAERLAQELLARVKKRTPVGDYSKEIEVTAKRDSRNHKKGDVYRKRINPGGKMGGTLRRGWTIGEIVKEGSVYKIEVINPVEYAPYVEHGHRTADHKGWVKGHFMLTISEQELQEAAPGILEAKMKEFLKGCMK